MIRVTFLLRRKSGLSASEFSDYWLNEHGPLVSSVSNKLNMLRYVQVHTLDDPANEAMARARGGMEPVYDGVAEVWFENRAAFVAATATAEGRNAGATLVADEEKFIDLAQSTVWLGYEYPQVNGTPENLQVHRALDDELCEGLRKVRGCEVPPYLGHAELWFDRTALQTSTPERAASGQRAIEDESTFIDFARSSMWLSKEHPFVDRR